MVSRKSTRLFFSPKPVSKRGFVTRIILFFFSFCFVIHLNKSGIPLKIIFIQLVLFFWLPSGSISIKYSLDIPHFILESSEEFQPNNQPTTEDEGSTDDRFVLPGRFARSLI